MKVDVEAVKKRINGHCVIPSVDQVRYLGVIE